MDRFADLQALVAIVESGSFSAAAERLGVAKSVVSRRLTRLEERLGSNLLLRTTRRLTLTDTGRAFFQRAQQILNDLDEAEQLTSEQAGELRGPIRLAAPMSFGLRHLSAALAEFMQLHPKIELDLDLNDRRVNLVEEGFDMAVRIGDLPDSSLVARRLGTIRSIACASPQYLASHGVPGSPQDLAGHPALQYAHLPERQQWTFTGADGEHIVAQPRTVMRANNGEALAEVAAAGIGIVSGPTFILNDYCQRGALRPILQQWQRPSTGLYAVYPPGRLLPARIRTLSEFLSTRYGDHPDWDACLG